VPGKTSAWVTVNDVKQFHQAWKQTAFGRALDDQSLKAFRDDTQARLDKGTIEYFWFVGLTWDEIRHVAAGALTTALVREPGQEPAVVLIVDVQGQTKKALALIEHCGKRLSGRGFGRAPQSIPGGDAVSFNAPTGKSLPGFKQYVYFVGSDSLVAGSSLAAVKGVVARLKGNGSDTLAGTKAFGATTLRAAKAMKDHHFRWFSEPLVFWSDWRSVSGERPRTKPDRLAVMQKEGFGAIKGHGGCGQLETKTHSLLAKAFIFAPRPWQRAMRMLEFANTAVVPPPAWVPRNVTSFTTLSLDIRKAFDNYGTLFDALYGDGEKGAFDDVLRDLRYDPDGPRVDLRKEVVDQLQSPLFFLTDLAPKTTRERRLVAARVKQDKVVAGALNKLFKDDKSARKLAFGDHGLWEILPEKSKKKDKRETNFALPASALAVHQSHFLQGATPEMLKEVFAAKDGLAGAPEYQRIMDELTALAGDSACCRVFFRLAGKAGAAYEDFRADKQRDELLARWLRTLVVNTAPEQNKTVFDLNTLPVFDKLQIHFTGEGGAVLVSLNDGWSLEITIPRSKAP
jgi:hypothetical protein